MFLLHRVTCAIRQNQKQFIRRKPRTANEKNNKSWSVRCGVSVATEAATSPATTTYTECVQVNVGGFQTGKRTPCNMSGPIVNKKKKSSKDCAFRLQWRHSSRFIKSVLFRFQRDFTFKKVLGKKGSRGGFVEKRGFFIPFAS